MLEEPPRRPPFPPEGRTGVGVELGVVELGDEGGESVEVSVHCERERSISWELGESATTKEALLLKFPPTKKRRGVGAILE